MILRPRETRVVRRVPKWLLAVLVISLLINGLVVGAIASRWQSMHAATPALGSSSNAQLYGFAVTLPAERRQEVWKTVEGDRAAIRPLRQTVHAARDEARKILLAEPFDATGYAAAQKRLFDAEQEMRLRALDVIQAIAQQLTPNERAAFARWEEDDRSRRRAFWRGMRSEDDKRPRQGSASGKD
jgi:uncharacterized membrane protein